MVMNIFVLIEKITLNFFLRSQSLIVIFILFQNTLEKCSICSKPITDRVSITWLKNF